MGRDKGINIPSILADPYRMDKMIAWRMGDPRYRDKVQSRRFQERAAREQTMQRQWNIEARADFEDPEKNAVITEAVRRAAVNVNATIALLLQADGYGQKPQVVCYSDDFFIGHQEIALLDDTLGKALETHDATEQEAISPELIAAAKEMSGES